MSTLKVWCERCDGLGECAEVEAYPEAPVAWVDCPDCKALGYIAREVVELPDGRAVVVTRDVLSKAGVRACDEFNLACDDFHEGISDKLDAWDRSVAAALTALFTGGVYEAEAVGRLGRGDAAEIVKSGDLIAIGLKEVGRGKA